MANNLAILDGAAASKTVKTTDNAGVHTPHHNVDTLPALPAGSNTIGNVGITGTVPLPTGAATSAKQPALGTAGSASADVISVQGVASMTALKVDGSAVTQPVSGTFWQTTQPVSLASLPALPAGTNTIGLVNPRSGKTVVHAAIDIATATIGDNTIVAAQGAGLKIKVVESEIVVGGATTLKWKSGASTVNIGGEAFAANGGIRRIGDGNLDYYRQETAANEALVLNSSAAVAIGGYVKYVVET